MMQRWRGILQAIQRRATTLLEMIVVGIVLMSLIGSITSFFSYMPKWFKTVRGRVDVVREEQIARNFLVKEASTATECICNGTELRFTDAAANTVDYYLAQMSGRPAGTYELRRTTDNKINYQKIATQLSEFSCATSGFDGVDVCMVFHEGSGWRRTTFQSRNTRLVVRNIALGDFNRDGISDLATVHTNVSQTAIQMGVGNGTFGAATGVNIDIATIGKPRDVKALDYDRDGDLDLIVLGETAMEKFSNNGSGTFSSAGTISAALTGSGPYKLAVADFNKDGQLDLAVSNETTKKIKILSGSLSGTFTEATTPVTLTYSPREMATDDIDHDGDPDLIVGCVNGGTSTLVVVRNTGNTAGGLAADATTYDSGPNVSGLAVGDFNRDGYSDVLSLDLLNAKIWMWPGRTNGGNGPLPLITTNFLNDSAKASIYSGRPQAISVMDWNGDGYEDLVVVNRPRSADSTATVHIGQAGSPYFTTTSATTVTLAVGARDGWAVATGPVTRSSMQDFVAAWSRPIPTDIANPIEYSATLGPYGTPPRVATFTSGVTLTTGANAGTAVVGDFFRDGWPDVLVGRLSATTFEVFTNSPTNSWVNPNDYALNTINTAFEAGDMDRDGDLDAVASSSGDRFRVYLNGGKADFTSGDNINTTDMIALGLGEFRRNGILDVVCGRSGGNLGFILNDGSGTNFSLNSNYAAGAGITDLCVGDFNRDGMPDVIVTTSSLTAAQKLRYFQCQNNATRFAAAANVTPNVTTTGADKVVCADFDRDGMLDIAVLAGNDLTIRRGLGTGATFATGTAVYTLPFAPNCITTGDLNRDGWPDIIIGCAPAAGASPLGRVLIFHKRRNSSLWFGQNTTLLPGATGWETPYTIMCGRDIQSVRVVDYNRDGKPDIVATNGSTSNASLLRANW